MINNRNITIYGGFAGTETSIDERDVENNPTYPDGNVYHREDPLTDATHPENFNLNTYAQQSVLQQ